MRLVTKLFGDIEIDDEKIVIFENGIIGFPDLKKFTLIYDEENQGEQLTGYNVSMSLLLHFQF